jgi:DNA-binding CsgD family transcriptional regulator
MGIAAEDRRNRVGGRSVSVFLFDRSSGGAGFAVQADDHFAEILNEAEKILDCCVPGCVSGCPSCVLTSDMNEGEARLLDRGPALEIVRSLAADASPLEVDQIGSTSRLVLDLHGEIERGFPTAGTKLILRIDSPLTVSGFTTWSLRGVIDRWRRRGGTVSLSIPVGTTATLDSASILSFRDQLSILDLELAIFKRIVQGESNKHIARFFSITEPTVKAHVKNIFRKIGANNRTQAAIWALNYKQFDDVNGVPRELPVLQRH